MMCKCGGQQVEQRATVTGSGGRRSSLFVLLLLFGCSYNAAYAPQISPRGGVDCSKFASEYNDAERKICQAKD